MTATADLFSFDSSEKPPWPVRRFTVDEYRQLGKCGVLTPEDRVELLEGWIVPKMNQRPAHGFVVGALTEWLHASVPTGFVVRCQLPMSTERSEPEPDLAVVIGSHLDYRERHPSGGDCRLVIEVADTSIERDRLKGRIYANAGVLEYWIFNLVDRQLECFTGPAPSGYLNSQVVKRGELAELTLGEKCLQLELDALFSKSPDARC